jgi:hypothetical protein
VRLWVGDLAYYLARALRAVGVGLAAVAWASALASQAQQFNDLRAYALVGSAIVGVVVSQWFAGLPPSARPLEVVRGLERDIVAVARELARGDHARQQLLTMRMAVEAVERLRGGSNVPRDRRAWLRVLAARRGDDD